MNTLYLGADQTIYTLTSGKEIVLLESELQELMQNNDFVQDLKIKIQELEKGLIKAESNEKYYRLESSKYEDDLHDALIEKKCLEEILEWASYGNIGVSANTLLYATTGKSVYGNSRDIPYDASDFQRCLNLCNSVRRVKENLSAVTKDFPKWIPIIRDWDILVNLLNKDSRECYEYLRNLKDECYECGGYTKVSDGHWVKKL